MFMPHARECRADFLAIAPNLPRPPAAKAWTLQSTVRSKIIQHDQTRTPNLKSLSQTPRFHQRLNRMRQYFRNDIRRVGYRAKVLLFDVSNSLHMHAICGSSSSGTDQLDAPTAWHDDLGFFPIGNQ